jgi:hypothetical protein
LLADSQQRGPVGDDSFHRKEYLAPCACVTQHHRKWEPKRRRRMSRYPSSDKTGLRYVQNSALHWLD